MRNNIIKRVLISCYNNGGRTLKIKKKTNLNPLHGVAPGPGSAEGARKRGRRVCVYGYKLNTERPSSPYRAHPGARACVRARAKLVFVPPKWIKRASNRFTADFPRCRLAAVREPVFIKNGSAGRTGVNPANRRGVYVLCECSGRGAPVARQLETAVRGS